MIEQVGYRNNNFKVSKTSLPAISAAYNASCSDNLQNLPSIAFRAKLASFNTKLTKEETKKYKYILENLKNIPSSPNSLGKTPAQQMEYLLKTGKLLSKANDNSTMLENLYAILKEKRVEGLDSITILLNVLDLTTNPKTVTQTFGDIPTSERNYVLSNASKTSDVLKNPSLMNVSASGTCAAASNEVNLADKYPAEFTRWVSGLSGEKKSVVMDIKLSSLSQNPLDAITMLNLMETKTLKSDLKSAKIVITADSNAYLRAQIQSKHWDRGERTPVDVLIQSAIMQTGSQNTYDSLTDTRTGKFNSNPQGLIEMEKTFVESLIKNQEITSLVYQQIDDNQNIVGYTCSFEKMEQHIKDAIDSGNNVICGYVETNKTAGRINSGMYNPALDGGPNKVINGHEITIVDYKKDKSGNTTFICVDTDDDTPDFVEIKAKEFLPKIHHAGFIAQQVAADEKEITLKANM